MRRAMKIGAIVLVVVAALISPYVAGRVATHRLSALVRALDVAAGDRVSLRITSLSRGYLSSDATIEVTIDAFTHEERFEAPMRIGHGPIPLPDIIAGRSAFRLCAGFASFDSGRGRGPTGTSLLPLRGRLVLGFFGGIEAELGIQAADIKPLTPLGSSSAARITLGGEQDEITLEAYLGEWLDRRSDAPSLELGGVLAVLKLTRGRTERKLEIARVAYQDGSTQNTVEQLELSQEVTGESVSILSARARMVRLEREDGAESLQNPSLSYESRRTGDVEQGTLALAFDAYSGRLGTYKRASLRGSTRISATAFGRFVQAIKRALEAPAAPAPRPSPSVAPREQLDPAALAVALFANLDDPRVARVVGAYRALLRSSPSASFAVEVRDGELSPLVSGRVNVSVDPAGVLDTDSMRAAARNALVLDVELGMSRALGLALARMEVERRASELPTADDAERREALVREVFDAALDAHVLVHRDDLFHLRASIPLGDPGRATFGGRPLSAYAAEPFGLALRRAEMPRVRIALGAVVSSGEITDGQVIIAISPRARDLRLCAEAELLDAPPTLEGDVQIALEVAPTGAVASTSVMTNTLNDESVAACLAHVLAQLPLPLSRRGGRSVVPIHITRGGAPSLLPETPEAPLPEPSPVPLAPEPP